MCQPRKWFWGLLPLAALWAGSVSVLTPQIESELTHRVYTSVRPDMPWLKPAVEGRDVNIEGTAPSDEARRRAMDAVLQVDGVRLRVNAAGLIPEVKPFAWSASRDAQKVTLTGNVAPEGVREQVLAEVRKQVPGATIVDEMKEARGASSALPAMTAVALGALGKLRSGSVALSDTALAIKGVAPDQATANAVIATAKKLPAPLQLAAVDVTALPAATPVVAAPPVPKAPVVPVERPYVWQGVREGNSLALTGFVPSEPARTQVVAAAKSALGGGRVVDQLKIATGLPATVDFGVASSFALTQLGQMRNGTAKLTDGNLEIEGELADAAGYKAVTAATSGTLPAGLKLEKVALTPPRVASYSWSAKREGKTLTLNGYFPDEGTRYVMNQAVTQRFADAKLTDRTSIASGAPAGFSAAMGMALDQLSQLESGEASIANGRLVVSGVAADEKTANEVKAALAKLVGGIPAEAKVTFVPPAPAPVPVVPPAPPAVVAAPTPPAPATVVATAPPVAPVTPPVAPKAALPAAPAVPAPVAVAKAPSAQPEPVAPKAAAPAPPKSTAPTAAAPATLPAAAAPAVPKAAPAATVPAVPTPTPVPPTVAKPVVPTTAASASCPADAQAAIKAGRIRFGTAKADIGMTERKALVRVVRALKGCATLKIEVGGHTDNVGSAGYNEKLAKTRAEAIRALLIKRGVDASRIRTAGYGFAKPVAANSSVAGRAQNRRIEFTVVE